MVTYASAGVLLDGGLGGGSGGGWNDGLSSYSGGYDDGASSYWDGGASAWDAGSSGWAAPVEEEVQVVRVQEHAHHAPAPVKIVKVRTNIYPVPSSIQFLVKFL